MIVAPSAGDAAGGQTIAREAARAETPHRSAGRIDSIDTLRALAMSAVIAEHCHILPFGWIGVWLFFVISGFVVSTSLLSRPSAEERRPGPLLGQFYVRRAARIWPIYLGYVLVGFVVSGLADGHFQWSVLASLVFFYNNFQSAFATGEFANFPVGHLWTIAVEFQFYIVYGLAFALLPARGLKWLLASMLVLSPVLRYAGGVWLQAAGFDPLRAAFAIYSFSAMHFDSFAAGALLALGRETWSRRSNALGLFAFGAAVFAAYCAVYVLVNRAHGAVGAGMFKNVISGILIGDLRQVWLYSVVAALSAGVLAITIADVPFWRRVTRVPLLQLVGRVSYGGYVYHACCIWLLDEPVRRVLRTGPSLASHVVFGVVLFAIALPATVAVAWVSYRYVERPIIAAVGRWLKRAAPAPAHTPPEPATGAAGSVEV